jgi:hydroxymethylglutaryl-CoA lyase
MSNKIIITETPRDGFQGLKKTIPTEIKIRYINSLLKCGFDTVEVGSFVSKRIIPQMADTAEVLENLDTSGTSTKIAVLTATLKGAEKACRYGQVDKIFFPFSTSGTFLLRNINKSIEDSEILIDKLLELTSKYGKEPVIYYSWAFGNPYGDKWNIELLSASIEKMITKGLRYFPLSDIDGEASAAKIFEVFRQLHNTFDGIQFGLHLHALAKDRIPKTKAAYKAGVRHFDTVNGGMGGCPMTGKELVANMDTMVLVDYFERKGLATGINKECLLNSAGILNGIL